MSKVFLQNYFEEAREKSTQCWRKFTQIKGGFVCAKVSAF
jgi:hypothetical protein